MAGRPSLGLLAVQIVFGSAVVFFLLAPIVAILPLAGMVDLAAERERLSKEIATAETERDRARAHLSNDAFLSRAPEQVIDVQRRRLATAEEQIALLTRRLGELEA